MRSYHRPAVYNKNKINTIIRVTFLPNNNLAIIAAGVALNYTTIAATHVENKTI